MSEVTVYTTEHCSFCERAKALLTRRGIVFREVHLSRRDVEARMRLVEMTGRPTFPQILVGPRPIGGWDDLHALDRRGTLHEALTPA